MEMKKKYLLLLLVSFLSFAQNTKEFSLIWNDNAAFVIGETKYIIPQFQSENFEFHEAKKSITYVNSFKFFMILNFKVCFLLPYRGT